KKKKKTEILFIFIFFLQIYLLNFLLTSFFNTFLQENNQPSKHRPLPKHLIAYDFSREKNRKKKKPALTKKQRTLRKLATNNRNGF
ncbi:hypothetical protein, partial [Marinilabilia salmonicolor]|uniref:hypothetical protein n=1 Tax=Marinilabilia salmonicolor TaxID=989 RepID=UPI00029ADB6D